MKDFNRYHFLHKLHLHEFPSQFSNRFLKVSRVSEDLPWHGKLFQVLGPEAFIAKKISIPFGNI